MRSSVKDDEGVRGMKAGRCAGKVLRGKPPRGKVSVLIPSSRDLTFIYSTPPKLYFTSPFFVHIFFCLLVSFFSYIRWDEERRLPCTFHSQAPVL